MDVYCATEMAYKNGYEQGQKDTIAKIIQTLIDEYSINADGVVVICVDADELEGIAAKLCNR